MEYIKKEELIEGEIYVFDNKFINKIQNGHLNIKCWISIPGEYFYKKSSNNQTNNIINATSEEKHWLNTCIKQDKFITFEEAMKTFIPEYVELINTDCRINCNIPAGKIYKCSKDITKTYHFGFFLDSKHRIGFNENEFDRYLKPSTKEAYDAQFVVKEPEFVLPDYWCIKVTEENRSLINELRRKKRIGCKNPIKYDYLSSNNFAGTSFALGTEITFEQFKKYVLKEEIVEEKVIEPLPQFKIIETIETITKVENNEGNQFFIGDVVKTEDGLHFKIIGFKYDENKTKILAIATDNYPEVVKDINDIEHYIEPKVEVKEETLLEKAKRLYPIGTKFRVACYPKYIGTVKDHKDYPFQDIDIVNLNTIENIDGCTGMTVFYKGKWAEIINE